MKTNTKKLVYAAVCLALCLVLPFLTGQIPQIGQALSPMHIPVFLCGFLCGWPWALVVGAIAPLLRSLLFHMPAMYPQAVGMAFELATYGLVSGLLYKLLPKKTPYIYVTLIAAMLCGRVVWGLARYVMAGLSGSSFPWSAFVAGAFTNAIPGIILHIVLVPVLVIALKRAKLLLND
ncbi:MAG: ECF transporter S component [Oscillospiraceae bacterium]|nr:ECF transporter S component [Oscillospiraceae bacterium]